MCVFPKEKIKINSFLAIMSAIRLNALTQYSIYGYLLKIINPLTLSQIKLYMDPANKNKKKSKILIFQSYFCKTICNCKKK